MNCADYCGEKVGSGCDPPGQEVPDLPGSGSTTLVNFLSVRFVLLAYIDRLFRVGIRGNRMPHSQLQSVKEESGRLRILYITFLQNQNQFNQSFN
jgi:hypothetical protein